MRNILRKYMPFLASGLVFGYSIPFSLSTFFYVSLLIVAILLIYVKPEYNFTIYQKTVALFTGVFFGAIIGQPECGMVATIAKLPFPWHALWLDMLAYLAAILMYSHISKKLQDKNIKTKIKWKDKNLFEVRKYDLERLKNMVFDKEVCSIGLESEWGQGKSFLVEGLLEILDDKDYEDNIEVDYVVIDVMAIRMDKQFLSIR